MRHALLALSLASLAPACGPTSPLPARHVLYEKQPYQLLYRPDGRLLRLLYDGNGDGRADIVTLYGPDGKPRLAEIDTDLDGAVDRWEQFAPGGALEKVATARSRPGHPDAWQNLDASGAILRSDFDDDGDGTVDRIESVPGGAFREAQDTDGDGRPDRWLVLEGERIVAEELDTSGDGRPDRRLVRGPDGQVVGVEADPDQDGAWSTVLLPRRGGP